MRLLALTLLVSCARAREPYLDDEAHRTASLRASLPHDTAYARLRLSSYAAWSALPERSSVAVPALLDRATLLRLGEEAFHRYALQPAPRAAGFGLQSLVTIDGRAYLTCATCHARDGVAGLPNEALDLGAALVDALPRAPAEARAVALAWGPGRVDVSTTHGGEPAHIPDLRPVRFQRYLQHSGAVRQVDVTSLALRIETLIITTFDQRARPPRAIALGLALYLHALADALPAPPPKPPSFERACGGCHEGEGLAGELVDAEEVATDPLLARSEERGTGRYRVPSLRGVGARARLMHDGSLDLDRLLAPERDGGHRFGLDLRAAQRDELLRFLRAL